MPGYAVEPATQIAAIEVFSPQNEEKDLLRLSTAGSVDDGKSTLIGRLLHDANGVYEDQLASIRQSPFNRSSGAFDLALLTDGLRAEREQGITIDVAYRYFSTPKRKFIIADTPGHEQYTRNMATGASTANLTIVLVDARNGVLPQSRRHAFIASLLGIQHIVVAVNKMDLVGYREDVFEQIRSEFADYASRLQALDLHFIPISALKGENVVEKSRNMPWFDGASLLHYLETVHIASDRNLTEFRFPVQSVMRPNQDFRGYAGQVASGVVKPGDPIMVLPSGFTSRVKSIVTYDGELEQAFAPMSVTVCLEDEIDVSRGDMLVPPSHPPRAARRLDARLVWMHDRKLEIGRNYLLKHTTQTVRAAVDTLRYRVNINTLEKEPASELGLNDIGAVVIETQKPVFCDPYRRNRATGSFILVDPMTNTTVAAGMITGREPGPGVQPGGGEEASAAGERVIPRDQQSRAGHWAVTVWLESAPEVAYQLERLLFDANCRVHSLSASDAGPYLAEISREFHHAGLITLIHGCTDSSLRERTCNFVGAANFLHIKGSVAAEEIRRRLEEEGFISRCPAEPKIPTRPQPAAKTHKGCTLWLTGMSGAGKSTLSGLLAERLRALGAKVEVLDGDVVRTHLSKGLGFGREDRDENIRRIGFLCELLSRNGVIAIAAAISPYRAVREELRGRIPNFVEIYVECPLETLVKRDVKGLYEKALRGEIAHFTGITDPYEAPAAPEVTVNSFAETAQESLEKIWAALENLELGLV
jgi:adenylyl-sulfate kinase